MNKLKDFDWLKNCSDITEGECVFCKSNGYQKTLPHKGGSVYWCPVCGIYFKQYRLSCEKIYMNWNHLSAYLFYKKFPKEPFEKRFFIIQEADNTKNILESEYKDKGAQPIPLYKNEVENWYPKSFSEKIDLILLYLDSQIHHLGDNVFFTREEVYSWLFVDRFDFVDNQRIELEQKQMDMQANFVLDYMYRQDYIGEASAKINRDQNGEFKVALTPAAYHRVDELRKENLHTKHALVAMEFSERTNNLREMIRLGVSNAGYTAIFIDEIQHNDWITPELLKYIKTSRFVVVDLTHKNNGAYFEEGYAMGSGKIVIQLCQKNTNLHFDVAQKNTIMWETEEDIPEKLEKRIRATVD